LLGVSCIHPFDRFDVPGVMSGHFNAFSGFDDPVSVVIASENQFLATAYVYRHTTPFLGFRVRPKDLLDLPSVV
jgi:hypothetical protein